MNDNRIDTYTVIDIETPNRYQDSICSIALVHVENDIVVSKDYYLINPEESFDDINIKIHNITRSMVKDKPNFANIWDSISKYFTNGIIVAHNATFDLGVISKALRKYSIDFPDFFYVCTCNISKSIYKNSKYKLDELCQLLDIVLEDHHDAMSDAVGCYELFKNIKTKVNMSEDYVETYHLSDDYEKKIPQQIVTKALNTLYGLILGIEADRKINQTELAIIRKWIGENRKYSNIHPFDLIINKTMEVLEDSIITSIEKNMLLDKMKRFLSTESFTQNTLTFQILMGILEGISCDKLLNYEELSELQKWLNENSHLKGNYPYDIIIKILEDVLSDGIVTSEENSEVLKIFNDFINPTETKNDGVITLKGKAVCLTGDFIIGSKSDVSEIVISLGGEMLDKVTLKTNILVVGGEGSDNWSYGNYGTKVKKALEYNSKGMDILIIGESDFLEMIKR